MKNFLIYLIVALLTLSAEAQDVVLKVEYPAVVTEGQQFNVAWTVNAGGGEFSAPSFNGFYKIMGPQQSSSSFTQYINGKMTREVSFTYVYFLQSVKVGKYVIAPALFKLKNKEYRSDSMHIEVVANASQVQNNPPDNKISGDQKLNAEGGEIFINLSLSRKEVYVGEHLVAAVKLYTRVNLAGINEIKYPSFNGFLKTDLETPPLKNLTQENVNGTVYGSGLIQQFLLYPQVPGELTIDPVQITVLEQQKSGESDPFFGGVFDTYQNVPKVIVSKPLKIKVKPLPGDQPSDFSGVIGEIDLKAVINKDTVNVNDAVTFKVTISGSGNLKIASAPALKLSPDIEVYDPKVADNIKNGLNGTNGQKSFEYLLIPRHYGDFNVPALTYSYFDISAGKYIRLTTPEFHFHAKKGTDQNTGITVYGGVSKEDVKYLGKDIRFIKTSHGNLKKSGNIIVSGRSFYSAYIFALFAFLLVLFLRREHIRRNSDKSQVRNRKAGKIAGKRLFEASQCLKNQEIDKFYEEILKALWGYLSDKLSIPVSELNRNNAIASLTDKGIDDERLNTLIKLLDTCEFARFSPSVSGTEAETIYNEASQFIRSIENTLG
jgi:hypothetical protein